MSGPRLLLAEDDDSLRSSLTRALGHEGYDVRPTADGVAALAEHDTEPADVLVLDVMMPTLDGLTVTRRLRAGGDRVPILLPTARAAISDRVAGLEAGADDYLVKPFALDELLARLRALLRRSGISGAADTLELEDCRLDPAARRAWRGERELSLTRTEFDLLELLLANADIVLPRALLYERIWGYDFETSTNNLDVYVGYLRRKTEAGGEPRLIQTVRGIGYVARTS